MKQKLLILCILAFLLLSTFALAENPAAPTGNSESTATSNPASTFNVSQILALQTKVTNNYSSILNMTREEVYYVGEKTMEAALRAELQAKHYEQIVKLYHEYVNKTFTEGTLRNSSQSLLHLPEIKNEKHYFEELFTLSKSNPKANEISETELVLINYHILALSEIVKEKPENIGKMARSDFNILAYEKPEFIKKVLETKTPAEQYAILIDYFDTTIPYGSFRLLHTDCELPDHCLTSYENDSFFHSLTVYPLDLYTLDQSLYLDSPIKVFVHDRLRGLILQSYDYSYEYDPKKDYTKNDYQEQESVIYQQIKKNIAEQTYEHLLFEIAGLKDFPFDNAQITGDLSYSRSKYALGYFYKQSHITMNFNFLTDKKHIPYLMFTKNGLLVKNLYPKKKLKCSVDCSVEEQDKKSNQKDYSDRFKIKNDNVLVIPYEQSEGNVNLHDYLLNGRRIKQSSFTIFVNGKDHYSLQSRKNNAELVAVNKNKIYVNSQDHVSVKVEENGVTKGTVTVEKQKKVEVNGTVEDMAVTSEQTGGGQTLVTDAVIVTDQGDFYHQSILNMKKVQKKINEQCKNEWSSNCTDLVEKRADLKITLAYYMGWIIDPNEFNKLMSVKVGKQARQSAVKQTEKSTSSQSQFSSQTSTLTPPSNANLLALNKTVNQLQEQIDNYESRTAKLMGWYQVYSVNKSDGSCDIRKLIYPSTGRGSSFSFGTFSKPLPEGELFKELHKLYSENGSRCYKKSTGGNLTEDDEANAFFDLLENYVEANKTYTQAKNDYDTKYAHYKDELAAQTTPTQVTESSTITTPSKDISYPEKRRLWGEKVFPDKNPVVSRMQYAPKTTAADGKNYYAELININKEIVQSCQNGKTSTCKEAVAKRTGLLAEMERAGVRKGLWSKPEKYTTFEDYWKSLASTQDNQENQDGQANSRAKNAKDGQGTQSSEVSQAAQKNEFSQGTDQTIARNQGDFYHQSILKIKKVQTEINEQCKSEWSSTCTDLVEKRADLKINLTYRLGLINVSLFDNLMNVKVGPSKSSTATQTTTTSRSTGVEEITSDLSYPDQRRLWGEHVFPDNNPVAGTQGDQREASFESMSSKEVVINITASAYTGDRNAYIYQDEFTDNGCVCWHIEKDSKDNNFKSYTCKPAKGETCECCQRDRKSRGIAEYGEKTTQTPTEEGAVVTTGEDTTTTTNEKGQTQEPDVAPEDQNAETGEDNKITPQAGADEGSTSQTKRSAEIIAQLESLDVDFLSIEEEAISIQTEKNIDFLRKLEPFFSELEKFSSVQITNGAIAPERYEQEYINLFQKGTVSIYKGIPTIQTSNLLGYILIEGFANSPQEYLEQLKTAGDQTLDVDYDIVSVDSIQGDKDKNVSVIVRKLTSQNNNGKIIVYDQAQLISLQARESNGQLDVHIRGIYPLANTFVLEKLGREEIHIARMKPRETTLKVNDVSPQLREKLITGYKKVTDAVDDIPELQGVPILIGYTLFYVSQNNNGELIIQDAYTYLRGQETTTIIKLDGISFDIVDTAIVPPARINPLVPPLSDSGVMYPINKTESRTNNQINKIPKTTATTSIVPELLEPVVLPTQKILREQTEITKFKPKTLVVIGLSDDEIKRVEKETKLVFEPSYFRDVQNEVPDDETKSGEEGNPEKGTKATSSDLSEGSFVYPEHTLKKHPEWWQYPSDYPRTSLQDALDYAFNEIDKVHPLKANELAVVVMGPNQKLYLMFKDEQGNIFVKDEYIVSTGRNGFSNILGTQTSPIGVHKIWRAYGDGVPVGGLLKGGKYMGKVLTIVKDNSNLPTDVNSHNTKTLDPAAMTTRAFSLESAQAKNSKTNERGINIHGTNHELFLGVPASGGCIRVSNSDVLELYNLIGEGTYVNIVPGSPIYDVLGGDTEITMAKQKPETPASDTSEPLAGKVIVLDAGHGGIDPGALSKGLTERDINLAFAKQVKKYLEEYGATVYMTRETSSDFMSGHPQYKKDYFDDETIDNKDDKYARTSFANDKNADLFISLHSNKNGQYTQNALKKGVETYLGCYCNESSRNNGKRDYCTFKESDLQSYKTTLDKFSQTTRGFRLEDNYKFAKILTKKFSESMGIHSAPPKCGDLGVLTGFDGLETTEPFDLYYPEMNALLMEMAYMSDADDLAKLNSSEYQEKGGKAIADAILEFLSEKRTSANENQLMASAQNEVPQYIQSETNGVSGGPSPYNSYLVQNAEPAVTNLKDTKFGKRLAEVSPNLVTINTNQDLGSAPETIQFVDDGKIPFYILINDEHTSEFETISPYTIAKTFDNLLTSGKKFVVLVDRSDHGSHIYSWTEKDLQENDDAETQLRTYYVAQPGVFLWKDLNKYLQQGFSARNDLQGDVSRISLHIVTYVLPYNLLGDLDKKNFESMLQETGLDPSQIYFYVYNPNGKTLRGPRNVHVEEIKQKYYIPPR